MGPGINRIPFGGIFLRMTDKIVPHLHLGEPMENREGPQTQASRNLLLFLAITIHNIPEGLAVGVGFGAVAAGISQDNTLLSAVGLAIGIGIRTYPKDLLCPCRSEPMETAG